MANLGLTVVGGTWLDFLIHLTGPSDKANGAIALCYAQVY